jgi:hypothetical protein
MALLHTTPTFPLSNSNNMLLTSLLSLLLPASLAVAADNRVWLAGDSTMAINGGNDRQTQVSLLLIS